MASAVLTTAVDTPSLLPADLEMIAFCLHFRQSLLALTQVHYYFVPRRIDEMNLDSRQSD
jgi:hypothetical protein